jgi:ribosomal-protein-alanine N-acetyltransferase
MLGRTELHTDRLLLRPWRLNDVDEAYAYASDPEWGRYLWRTPQPYTYRDAEEWVSLCVLNKWEHDAQFAIELDGHVIGGVRLNIVDPEGATAGIGYNVARHLWGQGFATEAARAVLDWAFRDLRLRRVFATADARNLASIRVMQKLGMRHEGTLRRHRFYRGEHADEIWYAVLSEEHLAIRS